MSQQSKGQDADDSHIWKWLIIRCVLLGLIILMPPQAKVQAEIEPVDVVIEPVVVQSAYIGTTPVPTLTPTPTPTSTPTPTPTSIPTPTPTPTIGPLGDLNGNPAPAPEMYPWADWAWRDYASHIVAGECSDCPQARQVVACTLIRDVLQGWEPYNLRKRWYGWMEPKWEDRMAVWDALQPGGCSGLPWYRYVGNESDYGIWIRKGIITGDEPVDWYGNTVAVR